jgi:hypothetical protein
MTHYTAMMVSTHILAGIALGLISFHIWPQNAFLFICVSAAAAVFPDLDVLFEHRRTFHRPLEYTVFCSISAIIAIFYPLLGFLGLFAFGSLTLYCVLDLFSTDGREKALYNHVFGEWVLVRNIVPTRSFKDALAAFLFSIPAYLYLEESYHISLVFLIGYSLIYPLFKDSIESRLLRGYSSYTEAIKSLVGSFDIND